MRYKITASCTRDSMIAEEYPYLKYCGLETVDDELGKSNYVTLNSIEELMTMIDLIGHPAIVYNGESTIEIYDGWRE